MVAEKTTGRQKDNETKSHESGGSCFDQDCKNLLSATKQEKETEENYYQEMENLKRGGRNQGGGEWETLEIQNGRWRMREYLNLCLYIFRGERERERRFEALVEALWRDDGGVR